MPTVDQKELAATCMDHLVDHDWHGYTWDARWGNGQGVCAVVCPAGTAEVAQGDRDCSSGIISAYEAAGIGCGGATYTGNMRSCMLSTGNFRAHPMDAAGNCIDGYIAQRGDTYLNEANHTAMCVSAVPDMLAEFTINEHGGCYGGQTGDQTGSESRRAPFYSFPWDTCLECIVGEGATKPPTTAPEWVDGAATVPVPHYRVWTRDDGWLDWMEGMSCSDGCGDDYAGMPGHWIYDVDFDPTSLGPSGWWQLTLSNGAALPKNVRNEARELPVTGITCYYDTPEPAATGYYEAVYRVAAADGNWLKWEHDDDDDGAGGAGPIDRFQLKIERV